MSSRLTSRFIYASLIYFMIGTFWMVFHRYLPTPSSELGAEIYAGQWIHLLTVGWLTLAVMGVLYYVIPKAYNTELYSERLGYIHFWLTNIAIILAVILGIQLSMGLDPLLNNGMTIPDSMMKLMPIPLLLDVVNITGWLVQIIFIYNIIETVRK